MKHLVIVGGGFGGVHLARKLGDKHLYKITLISDQDCFRYYPALYRSATGHRRQESCIALPMLLGDLPDVTFMQAKATKIDRAKRQITLEGGEVITYDEAVLALGVVTSYFGIPGIKEHAHGIKTPDELDELRHDLHEEFVDDRLPDKNYVVVGAGATGVELSAALRSYLIRVATQHQAKSNKISLELIEAAPRVLPRMSEKASRLVTKRLKDLGVQIMCNKKVEKETKESLVVEGRSIPTHTVIWTAGVINNPFFEQNKSQFELSDHGRVKVGDYLQVDDHLHVIGDNADTPNSGLALTAVRNGAFVAHHLIRKRHGATLRRYKPKKSISVIPVGKNWALVEYGKITFAGWPGAVLRAFADLMGYRDIMPLGQAIKLWLGSGAHEDDCEVCRPH